MNKPAVFWYLALCFGMTFLLQAGIYVTGLAPEAGFASPRALVLFAALLYVPAFSAMVTSIITGERDHTRFTVFPVSKNVVLLLFIGIPVLFAIPYFLGAGLTVTELDWDLRALRRDMPAISGPVQSPHPSGFIVATALLLTGVLGVTAGAVLALGSEAGWRGYLLQKLSPLGRAQASLLTGVCQGLWFAPLAAMGYLHQGHSGMLTSIGVVVTCVSFGLVLSEIHRITGSLGATSIACGLFFGQTTIVWRYLFPSADELLVAPFGILSSIVWVGAAIVLSFVPGRPAESGEAGPA